MGEQTTTFTTVTPLRERGEVLMFAAILVALGGLFLLGNFGPIAPISMRGVLSLWPLIPIGIAFSLSWAATDRRSRSDCSSPS